jgi:uncharacterized membrane protein YdjX (TVP38/TMEM64 family)
VKPRHRRLLVSLGLPVALLLAGSVAAHGLALRPSDASALLGRLGCWAMPAFVGLFIAGSILNLPGVAFLVAARLAFGAAKGLFIAYAGAMAAVTVAFLLARLLARAGGPRGADEAPRPLPAWVRRALAQLEARPVLTVALLRLALWLSPPLQLTLAHSPIRTRDYLLGSALGLALPVGFVVLASGLFT